MGKHELSDSDEKKPGCKSSKSLSQGEKVKSDGVEGHIYFLSDSDDAADQTKRTRKYVKWTKQEEEALVRMKDVENKSWDEITASGNFHDAKKNLIQHTYKRLKAAQMPQIAFDDVNKMWSDKNAKTAILTHVKEEICTRGNRDLTITNAKLESLLAQVISTKGKRT